ncbi:hypothetical protein QFZ36_002244 [Pseudarthrobacter siccitolerans]|uniref:Uncharacterized protein n=1 Tax=Pseudarthrobacter siccitolerans TaxID=861266 RepID=A0ABU0PL42_9MICC|nr:hypothetical protein [Pseudarthrobacter siccitolerans]MDQ0674683.1 hypothetical protein [Pseudarthrobacter siccitolerans]
MAFLNLARLQGGFNVINGLWPLVHMRSFEAVSGAKTDKWLVRTVSGLLITIGVEQLRAAARSGSDRSARRLGIGTAATLAAIDLIYVGKGRISKIYLLDAVVEILILQGWLKTPNTIKQIFSGRVPPRGIS